MKKSTLKKKYGFFTALGMVIGIVIGAGVFFKTEKILEITNGNLLIGVLAWILGGVIMMTSSYSFALLASRFQKINGLIDYSEALVSKRYSHFVGSYMAYVQYPAMTGVIAWLSSTYFLTLFPQSKNLSATNYTIAICIITIVIIILFFLLNLFAPKIAGKFQISTTYIKLIPIVMVVLIGVVYGLIKQQPHWKYEGSNFIYSNIIPAERILISNFKQNTHVSSISFFKALVATAFAYEGWIIATSINSEIKKPKKTLPKALLVGTGFTMIIYILYYLGLAGAVSTNVLKHSGGVNYAFKEIFGPISPIITGFIVISCLGTENGLMLANVRGIYSLAARDTGMFPNQFKQLSKKSNMPVKASIVSLILAIVWFLFFYGPKLANKNWNSSFNITTPDLAIAFTYVFYILIYIMMMKKLKDLNPFKRFIMPILALISGIVMIFAMIYSYGNHLGYFLMILYIVYCCALIFEVINNKKRLTSDKILIKKNNPYKL